MQWSRPFLGPTMDEDDEDISDLAAQAGQAAFERALATAGAVVIARGGQLIELRADGTYRVIKELGPLTPVPRGQRRVRRHGSRGNEPQ